MPPEPPGLTLYFSDILKVEVVKDLYAIDEVEESRPVLDAIRENLIISSVRPSFFGYSTITKLNR